MNGSSVAGGREQRHAVRGNTASGYVLVGLIEAVDSDAYVLTRTAVVNYLKVLDKRSADATGWSESSAYGGAEYYTFRTAQSESCVGFRKLGEPRRGGFAWMMHGLLCAPSGEVLQPAPIQAFIDSARVR